VLLGGPGGARGEGPRAGGADRAVEGAPPAEDFKASDDDVPF